MEKEAVPLLRGSWAKTFEPSVNVTMPDGTLASGGAATTVAVKLTVCPGADGFCDEFNVVVVALAWIF